MAVFGKREPTNDASEQAAGAAEQVAAAANGLADAEPAGEAITEVHVAEARTAEGDVVTEVEVTEVAPSGGSSTEQAADQPLAIPPLLTDVQPGTSTTANALADRAGLAREKAAEHAGAAREKATEHVGAAREKAAEHAAAAREKLAESAGEAKERLAGGAAEAKVRGAKMGKRFAEAAADARDSATGAAAQARERMANADVNEFAHSTTRLIDQARPFFLAGFAVVFAVLGFLEGDSGTAQLFVGGSILFVIGAGFSSEINTYIAERLHRAGAARHEHHEHGEHRPGSGGSSATHDREPDER